MNNIDTGAGIEYADVWRENEDWLRKIAELSEIAHLTEEPAPLRQVCERRLARNYYFLRQQGMSHEDYCALLRRCVEADDYTELGLLFTHKYKALNEERYKKDPQDRSADFIVAAMEGRLSGLERVKRKYGKNQFYSIGGITPRDYPDWLLVIDNRDIGVYEALEELEAATGKKNGAETVAEEPPTDLEGFAELDTE